MLLWLPRALFREANRRVRAHPHPHLYSRSGRRLLLSSWVCASPLSCPQLCGVMPGQPLLSGTGRRPETRRIHFKSSRHLRRPGGKTPRTCPVSPWGSAFCKRTWFISELGWVVGEQEARETLSCSPLITSEHVLSGLPSPRYWVYTAVQQITPKRAGAHSGSAPWAALSWGPRRCSHPVALGLNRAWLVPVGPIPVSGGWRCFGWAPPAPGGCPGLPNGVPLYFKRWEGPESVRTWL